MCLFEIIVGEIIVVNPHGMYIYIYIHILTWYSMICIYHMYTTTTNNKNNNNNGKAWGSRRGRRRR